MSRESVATFATILLPLALTALAALAAWGTRAITKLIKDRRTALALEVIANGAAAVVADLAQHVVADLKDTSKPGEWTAIAKATVRVRAVERVKQLYPQAVGLAQEALANPERINDLLGTVVERAVVDLKAKSPAKAVAISADSLAGEPVLLDRQSVAPPAPIAPRPVDPQSGRVELGALGFVGILAVATAVLLSACPNWNRPQCGAPGRYSCDGDQPHYCAAATGELTPIGDEPCAAQGRVCALDDAGVATCARRADAGASD